MSWLFENTFFAFFVFVIFIASQHCSADVCLFVMLWYCIETNKQILKLFLPLGNSDFNVPPLHYPAVQCPALLSAPRLVETWSSLVPDGVSGIEHSASPVLRRGTVCRRTFVLHQHSVLSKICSRLIYFFIHFNYQLNFEKRMLYGALVVTLWTCYGAL